MATLTVAELAQVRRSLSPREDVPVDYTRGEINAAVQAVENWFEANRPGLTAAVATAVNNRTFAFINLDHIITSWCRYRVEKARVR